MRTISKIIKTECIDGVIHYLQTDRIIGVSVGLLPENPDDIDDKTCRFYIQAIMENGMKIDMIDHIDNDYDIEWLEDIIMEFMNDTGFNMIDIMSSESRLWEPKTNYTKGDFIKIKISANSTKFGFAIDNFISSDVADISDDIEDHINIVPVNNYLNLGVVKAIITEVGE